MSTNILYLIVGALVVVTAGLGYLFYQDHQQPDGVQINLGSDGVSIEEN